MGHDHQHQAGEIKHKKAFLIGIILNVAFVITEVIYGLSANSSALLADAGHNASDVLSLVFAWLAAYLASKKPQGKYTYGYRKTTILVSILNAFLLFGAVAVIAWEAIEKLNNPQPVAGKIVLIVAGVGVLINTATALLFMKGQKEDLNIKGAFLHMAADAGVSLGVVIGGLLIMKTGANWIDPVISFVIILIIVWGTWKLLIESIRLALDAVPGGISIEEVRDYLLSIDGVEDVHDLHIWAMSTTETALTTHLVVPEEREDEFLYHVRAKIHDKFGIEHATIQIEKSMKDEACMPNCK